MQPISHFSEQNYYEILEVSPTATSEEIQKAFFKAKATYSPSSPALYSVFSEDEAKELLRLIDEAYSVLSHHSKRREYDKVVYPNNVVADAAAPTSHPTPAQGDLPDFMLPKNEVQTEPEPLPVTKFQHTAPTSSAPASSARTNAARTSYGKTIMSHYDIDERMEHEIKERAEFDGNFLQKIRLYKNISLDALSEVSRINRNYLLAIETNDYPTLPAGVYVRGFIRSIARLLSLPEKKVVESYMKSFISTRGE